MVLCCAANLYAGNAHRCRGLSLEDCTTLAARSYRVDKSANIHPQSLWGKHQ